MKKKLYSGAHKENLQALQELRILEEDIIAARNFIYAKYSSQHKGKSFFTKQHINIPLYIILGPARFGKTTMLAHAGLNLVDVYQQPLQSVHPTKYCSFWFAQDAVYVDTAGIYTKPDVTRPRNDLIWQGFIKLLQKHFGKNALTGVLIVLDLPAIAENQDLLKRTLFYIRERIYETTHLVRSLQSHIVFTKCDRILGFNEFFGALDVKERTQPFGVVFAKRKQGDLVKDFISQFDRLLQHLNRRGVEYLSCTTSPAKCALLKSFPTQLDYLRPILVEVISKIPHGSHIALSGVYFTSSIQDGAPINPLKAVLLQVLNLKERLRYTLESHGDCSYFVKELFTQIVNPRRRPIVKQAAKVTSWSQYFSYTSKYFYVFLALFVSIVLGSVLGYKSYSHNVDIIRRTHLALQTQGSNEAKAFYVLSTELEKQTTSWWLKFGLNKTRDLYERLVLAHKKAFAEEVTSQLENFLNNLIDTSGTIDSAKLYHGLAVYLMLGNPQRLDIPYVENWFNNYWTDVYGESEQKYELLQQLAVVLRQGCKIAPNQHVVAAARSSLRSLPLLQQTYLLLENTYPYQKLNISYNKNIFLSGMYLKENFVNIYNDIIPNIATYLPQQDWVFGEAYPDLRNNISPEIIVNLRESYVTQYVNMWLNLFTVITRTDFKDLMGAAQYFREMASTESSLAGFLKHMQHNLHIPNSPAKFKQQIGDRLGGLQTLNLGELQHHFSEAAYYLAGMVHNYDSNAAAFAGLTKYLQHKTTSNPLVVFKDVAHQQALFVQGYLLVLINNTWQIIIDGSYKHITQAWNTLIMPKYRSTLEDKYPLFKDSKADVVLEDFTRFFGPHGKIDDFFNRYIEPLVVLDKTNWQWKSIDGVSLNFSPVFLEIFLRAALIQKMFYAHKVAEPHIEFTLKPVEMTTNAQSFTLHIDGQKVTTATDLQTQHLVWPGPNPGIVTISFVGTDGKYSTITELGAWAWFKVLDKANITSHRGTKNFDITFELNGNAAKYILASHESVNPFIPDVVSNFRCQEQ